MRPYRRAGPSRQAGRRRQVRAEARRIPREHPAVGRRNRPGEDQEADHPPEARKLPHLGDHNLLRREDHSHLPREDRNRQGEPPHEGSRWIVGSRRRSVHGSLPGVNIPVDLSTESKVSRSALGPGTAVPYAKLGATV